MVATNNNVGTTPAGHVSTDNFYSQNSFVDFEEGLASIKDSLSDCKVTTSQSACFLSACCCCVATVCGCLGNWFTAVCAAVATGFACAFSIGKKN